MDFQEFKGKTVEEATAEAESVLGVSSDKLEITVVDRGNAGFLGLGSKPAVILAKTKNTLAGDTKEYLDNLFSAMGFDVNVMITESEEEGTMDIELEGPEMGALIGKRGQTLDSIQYLTSLFVNKKSESYIRVKMDTENYRARRKETLENLAKNLAYRVKKTGRPFTLEPMNPYERRIIHSTLQNDKFVKTESEGEEPYRRVVISLKDGGSYRNNYRRNSYNR